jgi:hypothetical protein
MCAPVIMQSVREEISRRGFLTVLGSAVAATAASPPVGVEQKSVRLAKGFRDVHDLTHTFTSKTPVFPAFKPIQIKPKFSIAKDGFFANEIVRRAPAPAWTRRRTSQRQRDGGQAAGGQILRGNHREPHCGRRGRDH